MMRRDPLGGLVRFLTVLTSVALGLTGQVNPVAAFLVPPAVVAGIVRERRGATTGALFEWTFRAVGILALLYFLGQAAGRLQLLAGSVALIFVGQAYYAMKRLGSLEVRRLQLLAFFQMLALASTTTNILFLVPFGLYLATAPLAFTLWRLEARSTDRSPAPLAWGMVRRTLGASAVALMAAALVFPLIPRYEAGLLAELNQRKSQDLSGFSERVRFGDITSIKDSAQIVLRARIEGGVPPSFRWRGIALDRYDGTSWSLSLQDRYAAPRAGRLEGQPAYAVHPSAEPGGDLVAEVVLEPLKTRVLFHPAATTVLASDELPGVERDAWGNLYDPSRRRTRLEYRVLARRGGLPVEPLDETTRSRTTHLPAIDPRIEERAREVAGDGATPEVAARRLEAWLSTRFEYSTDLDDTGFEDPLAAFLFETRRGHCEYFASAMTVMLRTLDVPARIVNGFQRGELSTLTGRWTVRMRHAHSWVEAWIPGNGWTAYDPTPPQPEGGATGLMGMLRDVRELAVQYWDDHVIGFNIYDQINAVLNLRDVWVALAGRWGGAARWMLAAVAVLLVAGVGWTARRLLERRLPRYDRPRTPWMDRTLRRLERKGWRRPPGQTLLAWAEELRRSAGPAAAGVPELVRLYYASRFGGRRAEEDEIAELVARIDEIPCRREEAA